MKRNFLYYFATVCVTKSNSYRKGVPVMQTTTNSNNMDGSDSTEDIQNLSAKKRKVVCTLRPEVSSPLTSHLAKTDQSNIFGSLVSIEKKSKEKDELIEKLEKSLDEARNDLENIKQEKENSDEKLKNLRHRMVAKTFLLDPNNENLETLQTLETEKLFEKYEQGMMVKDSFKEKYEETIEKLSEVKTKLKLKSEKNDLLEEKLNEIMDKLNIPGKNRSFAYIIPAIRNIKTQSSSEQQENEHYTNAQNLVESVSSSVKNEKT